MKNIKTFLILFAWLAALKGNAQNRTLHVVLAADTLHPLKGFAQICAADFVHMRQEVSDMAAGANMKLQLYPVAGANFLPDRLQETVKNITVKSGDVALCYISCAAFCDSANVERDKHRRLRFGLDTTRTLDTRVLENSIVVKAPQLDIFIVDACGLVRNVPATKIKRSGGLQTVYQSLFAARGCIRAFSSQCGEYSYGGRNGSLFTNALREALDHYISLNFTSLTWHQVFDFARSRTGEKAAKMRRDQHPTHFFLCDFKDKN